MPNRTLRRTRVFVALGKNLFDLGVRAGNDVYGHELTDATRPGGPGLCRRFPRADVAAYHHRHIAGADVLLAHQDDAGRLYHRISRLDCSNETFGLDHSQSFEWHASSTVTDRGWWPCGLRLDQQWPTLTPAHRGIARSVCGE